MVSRETKYLWKQRLTVCDVTEAMSSRRPYRPAKFESAVLKELQEGKEKKYDSETLR